jgi:hypothetical protein
MLKNAFDTMQRHGLPLYRPVLGARERLPRWGPEVGPNVGAAHSASRTDAPPPPEQCPGIQTPVKPLSRAFVLGQFEGLADHVADRLKFH